MSNKIIQRLKNDEDYKKEIFNAIINKNLLQPKYLYVLTSVYYVKDNFYKIGISEAPEKRLSTYSTSFPENDDVYYHFTTEIMMQDGLFYERFLEKLLLKFKINNKEFYNIKPHVLQNFVNIIITLNTTYNDQYDLLNFMLETDPHYFNYRFNSIWNFECDKPKTPQKPKRRQGRYIEIDINDPDLRN